MCMCAQLESPAHVKGRVISAKKMHQFFSATRGQVAQSASF